MVVDVLMLAGGLLLLLAGGEVLVRGAVGVAARLEMSPAVIGMVVVGFATSSPELVVALESAYIGEPDLAVGNVVGSNIANVLLILGIGALIAPMAVDPVALRRDASAMVVASLAAALFALTGMFERWHGAILLPALLIYLAWSVRADRRRTDAYIQERRAETADTADSAPKRLWVSIALIVSGIAALVVGSSLMIGGATGLARAFGVSEALIGLTILAIGTSLPEIVTTVIAALRGHAEVALGNVIGSNLFNICAILGLTTMVIPLPVHPLIAQYDVWIALACGVLVIPVALTGLRIVRWEGASLLVMYVSYIGFLIWREPGAFGG